MITTLITMFILLAVFALVWWGVNALGLPPPIKVVVLVILGLIALAFIYNMFVGGNTFSLK
jgi:hypothetical protein